MYVSLKDIFVRIITILIFLLINNPIKASDGQSNFFATGEFGELV
jgi:hypothetical protein